MPPRTESSARASASVTGDGGAGFGKIRPIRVMVSSRGQSPFDGRPLSDFRKELRKVLEAEQLLGATFLDVRIHEEAPSDGSMTVFEWSKREVRRSDLLLVLYNGCSGGIQVAQGGLGVCHEEYVSAQALGMTVLWVWLPLEDPSGHTKHADIDRRFQLDVASVRKPAMCKTWGEAIAQARGSLRGAMAEKFHAGNTATRSPYDRGAALEWSQADYRRRQILMRDVVAATIGSSIAKRPDLASVLVSGEQILAVCDAVPGSMVIGAARELVGQPFLRDHEQVPFLQNRAGPVHIIACHRAITEAQALRMLGTPDATVLRPAFGVYLADEIQKVQVLLLGDCRDEYATRSRATEAMNWLREVGEDARFLARAKARKRIVQAVSKEQ